MSVLVLQRVNEVAIDLSLAAITSRDIAIENARMVGAVENPSQQAVAVGAMRELRQIAKDAETSRVDAAKRPFLDMGRRIDALTAEFLAPIEAERARVDREVVEFQSRERAAAAKAEAERQAEIRRLQREADAKQAEVDRAAKAERDRIFAEAASKPVSEQEAAKRQIDAQQRLADQEAAAAKFRAAQVISAMPVAPAPAKVTGQTVREVWEFEVSSPGDLYRAHPELCDIVPSRERIRKAIANGLREAPGVRIWSELKTGVRL